MNGPGQLNAYAREDGVAPEIAYTVTQAHVGHGKIWKASIKAFDLEPGGKVPCTITIDFTPHRILHPFIWTGIGVIGLVVFGAVVMISLKRLKVFGLRR